jgi:pimeloyl-ACP methyl ester carboxylesterase
MPIFDREGIKIRYRLEGSGPPVVLIHGVGAQLESWDGVAARLTPMFQVLRLDLRGHGESRPAPGPYSLPIFADDVHALMRHVGIDRADIAGHSLGAMIAQMFCLRHAPAVGKVAMLSGVAARTSAERERVATRIDLIRTGDRGEHFRNSLSRWFTDDFIAANPKIIAAYAARNANNDLGNYAAAYRVLALEDLDQELLQIRAPALIATGEHDLGSSPRMSEIMSERIKGSTLRILPGLKHSLLMEAPDVIARMLIPFFKGEAVPEIPELMAR